MAVSQTLLTAAKTAGAGVNKTKVTLYTTGGSFRGILDDDGTTNGHDMVHLKDMTGTATGGMSILKSSISAIGDI